MYFNNVVPELDLVVAQNQLQADLSAFNQSHTAVMQQWPGFLFSI